MKQGTVAVKEAPSTTANPQLPNWREAGAALGHTHRTIQPRARCKAAPNRRRELQDLLARARKEPEKKNAACVVENFRMIFFAEKDARDFTSRALPKLRAVVDESGAATHRVCLLARAYLSASGHAFQEADVAALLDGYQQVNALDMDEIWNLKPALQLELVNRLLEAAPSEWPVLVNSLRQISEISWRDLFESVSCTDKILARDPAGIYAEMDAESRQRYRKALAQMAVSSELTEPEAAEAAIDLCDLARSVSDGSRQAVRRTHVGYYLIDRGRERLESVIGYRPSFWARVPRWILRHPTAFYLVSIELLTVLIVLGILYRLGSLTPAYVALLVLILPATQAATELINNLSSFLVKPRVLPKLDFSGGIPDECLTMVAVPTLLLDEAQVRDLVLDLEIRFLANRDRNLCFALLTDLPDSDRPESPQDLRVELCSRLIEGLNLRYQRDGRAPFFLFHRRGSYNEAEGCWMGWERKRGKLLDLNRLLREAGDAFPVKVGDISILRQVRYVITLDSDTQLPRDAAARLVGTLAHPLNQAVVDPATHMVVEGYGILQPRVGISVQSAARSRLAALYSGQTGFDIYTCAVSDTYQDLFGEGIFTGKGIYEVDVLREVLEHRFPENALLSHDLIEGAYARVALVNDFELVDDYPSHFSAYSRRKHRWVRGDWQIIRWIQSRVPDYYARMVPNPITLISQWKIVDNLRRSLLEPALVLLLLSGWFWLPGKPEYWTAVAVLMWCVPVLCGIAGTLFRLPNTWRSVPSWLLDTARAAKDNGLIAMCSLTFLLHQALISADAIVRAIARVFVTRRKMLEWETAAESEAATHSKATVDTYLEWTPWIAILLGAAVRYARPDAFPAAAPLLLLWAVSRPFASWLDRRPRAGHSRLREDEVQLLRESADRICRFFRDWSNASTNWLIPDSVRDDGAVELKLSPTNLGMLLNARIAALHLGVMPVSEFVFETQQTLDQVARLPKHRGHLLNWYDINTLLPIAPLFVSSVDSGNLAASLWALKQAALAVATESAVKRGVTKELAAGLRTIADTCERLVREMDFRFLYLHRKKMLSIGYDVATGRLHPVGYNFLASEARTAAFVAIAKGDIPQEAWFNLSRTHTIIRGERVMLSWSGTMFEYLMPLLWMRHFPNTLLDQTARAAVRAQVDYGRQRGTPWGISESACLWGAPEGGVGYRAFGLPELGLRTEDCPAMVISPYSSFLAAGIDPEAAMENLRQMQKYGWFGRYGFYEAIEYTNSGGEAVPMWMAHHQGMSLLAIVNLLFDNPLRQYFHAEPQVIATELLLHERISTALLADTESVPLAVTEPVAA